MQQHEEEYEKPFRHEEELKEKLSRQFELNAQLDLESEKVVDADLGGIEKEENRAEAKGVAEKETPYRIDNPEHRR